MPEGLRWMVRLRSRGPVRLVIARDARAPASSDATSDRPLQARGRDRSIERGPVGVSLFPMAPMPQTKLASDVLHLTRCRVLLLGAAATLAACVDGTTAPDLASPGEELATESSVEGLATTRLDLTLDRSTITTELASTNLVTVTLTGSGGFGGTATLSGTLRDASNNALPGWTISFSPATVTVPVNGTATAVATITIPSENRGLAATAKISVASSAATGTFTRSASVTVQNQITLPIGLTNNLCTYPSPSPVNATIGTKLRWLNKSTNVSVISIHVATNSYGVLHQNPSPGLFPGQAYEQTLIGVPGASFNWYCHSPGPTGTNLIQPVN
jgi:hypothetical protein